jgi:predicted GH43/DUF377 family glycosyl hydrolase
VAPVASEGVSGPRGRRAALLLLAPLLLAATPGEDWGLGPFVRPAGVNPLLGPDPDPTFFCPVRRSRVRWQEKDVFNPAAILRDGKIHLLFRAEDTVGRYAGTSRIGLAASADGLRFERRPEPVLFPAEDSMKPYEWEGGCEDPRVVEAEDGRYVMTYTAYDGAVARLAVASSRDLLRWTKHGLAFGDAAGGRYRDLWSKSGSIVCRRLEDGRLVAARVRGRYWMYWGDTDVFAATSDDLVRWTPVERLDAPAKQLARRAGGPQRDDAGWTSFRPVLSARTGRFDSALVEPGPPALLTARGILLLYNASNAARDGDAALPAGAYAAGQALFDPQDPTAILRRAEESFFRPQADTERAGQVANVCFLEGLAFLRGRAFLYFGMADSRIGVAIAEPR